MPDPALKELRSYEKPGSAHPTVPCHIPDY